MSNIMQLLLGQRQEFHIFPSLWIADWISDRVTFSTTALHVQLCGERVIELHPSFQLRYILAFIHPEDSCFISVQWSIFVWAYSHILVEDAESRPFHGQTLINRLGRFLFPYAEISGTTLYGSLFFYSAWKNVGPDFTPVPASLLEVMLSGNIRNFMHCSFLV